jgi:hypothetical protein
MTIDRDRLVVGMQVVAADGQPVGALKQLRDADMLVDRSLRRDIFVPLSAISELSGQTLTLNVAADAIGDQGWEMPSPLPQEGEAAGEGEPASIVTGTGDPAERGAWSPAADDYDLDPADTVTGRDTERGVARPNDNG